MSSALHAGLDRRPPFDVERLDALMEAEGLDALVISSAYNLRYLLGGYRFFLYDKLDAVGISRYVPLAGYVRGRPDMAFYVGWGDEGWGLTTSPIWTPHVETSAWTAPDAASRAAQLLAERIAPGARVGYEPAFMASDAHDVLARACAPSSLRDATLMLDELRAIKSEDELAAIRKGAEAVVAAMLEVFAQVQPGQSTAEIAEALRVRETLHGLTFDYCLIAAAPDLNRAPSGQTLKPGAALSLDSGASYQGFVADLARMGIIGTPSALQAELLSMVTDVQQAARAEVVAGRDGGAMMTAAQDAIRTMPFADQFSFVAHGMGLRSHEAPRLNIGKPPYPATHRDRPLESGMVLSIETHVAHPEAGFVKLEDAVIVTDTGYEALGDSGRDWNQAEIS